MIAADVAAFAPVRAAQVPAAQRATREAIEHVRQAPLPQRWDVDRKEAAA